MRYKMMHKQAMVRLVKSGTSIADTPEAFYAEAKKHLTTENSKPGKCVHFRQTFHFTSKLANRPKVSNLTPREPVYFKLVPNLNIEQRNVYQSNQREMLIFCHPVNLCTMTWYPT